MSARESTQWWVAGGRGPGGSKAGRPSLGARRGFRPRRLAVTLLAVGVLAGSVRAREDTVPVRTGATPSYLIDAWETDNGLPENSTRQMVQMADGALWFGTLAGLVRFDGVKFTTFTSANLPGLPDDGIIALHLDAARRLWVSTLSGLAVSEPGRVTSLRPEPRWTGNYVRTIAENAGVLCLTDFSGRVFRGEGDDFRELERPPGPENRTNYGLVDRAGRISVAQVGFFGHWDGQKWVESPLAPEVTRNFRVAGMARDGGHLIGTQNELLRVEGDLILSRVALDAAVAPGWQAVEDSRGNVWVPTWGSGLYAIARSGAVTRMSSTQGLLSDSLRFVFEDAERNLWVGGGNGGGLIRLKPRQVVVYGLESGLQERLVKAVVEDETGAMLVGTYGKGIMRLADGRVTPWERPGLGATVPGLYVQCLLRDRAGSLWVGTLGNGLQVEADGTRVQVAESAIGGRNVNALFEDTRGRIWIGGDTAMVRAADGAFTPQRWSGGEAMSAVSAFAESPVDHSLWAVSDLRLYRLDGDEWREVLGPAGTSVRGGRCLHFDADGALWLGGTGIGLWRLKSGRWAGIGEAQGLNVSAIGRIMADSQGKWWLTSNRGLIRFAPADAQAVADGAQGRLPHQIFNLSDGLATLEFAAGYSSTAARDRAGRLWFATPRGVAMVEPQKLQLNAVPPRMQFEYLTYHHRQERPTRLLLPAASPVVLPPGSRQLEARYSVLSFTAPDKVRVRLRFERDGQLISDAEESGRTFHSDLLVAGDYKLTVTAANNDGIWNQQGVTLAFTVRPFYWETLWFRGGVLGLLLSGGGLAVMQLIRGRERRQAEKLARERELAAERARLASVLETTSDFVAFGSPEGRVLYVNAAGRHLVGLGASDGLEQATFRDFLTPEMAARFEREAMPAALATGHWSGESILRHANGTGVPVSQVIVAHRNEAGELDFVSTIARDITERKSFEASVLRLNAGLEQRVRDRTAELETANRELEAFVSSVSHDLRGPVRNITGYLELLATRLPAQLDEAGRRHFHTLTAETRRMSDVINDLLELSRLSRKELDVSPVDLADLVAEVRELLAKESGGRPVEWRIGALPVVVGDRSLLRQVLVNLLSNALKFSGKRAAAVIEIGDREDTADPAARQIFVRDNGAGFNPLYAAKLFGAFQRLHSQREFEGNGVGLATVKRIIERHGGRVGAEGAVGAGATFWFSLRRSAGTVPPPAADAAARTANEG